MQLGAVFPQTEIGSDPGAVRDFAVTAEELGYDYLLAYDHVIGADPSKHMLVGPYTHESLFHEPLVLFGYLAAITERMDLVTGILILPQRQTALVAKQVAEVDLLSGGRMILGVGVGWNQVEFEVLGEDFHRRGRRTEEQLELLQRLWTEELVTFEGRFDTVRHAGINPRPEREIPIWFGGMSSPVLSRCGRYGSGWIPRDQFPDDHERNRDDILWRLDRIRGHAREAGRDPGAIALCARTAVTDGDLDAQLAMARSWEDAGATHVSFNTMNAGLTSPQQHIDAITNFIEGYRG